MASTRSASSRACARRSLISSVGRSASIATGILLVMQYSGVEFGNNCPVIFANAYLCRNGETPNARSDLHGSADRDDSEACDLLVEWRPSAGASLLLWKDSRQAPQWRR